MLLKSSGSGTIALGAPIIADGGKGGDGALGNPGGSGGRGGNGGLVTIVNGPRIALGSVSAVGGAGVVQGPDSISGGCFDPSFAASRGAVRSSERGRRITHAASTRITGAAL